MPVLLSPTLLHTLQWQRPRALSNLPSNYSQRLTVTRITATASLNRGTDQRSEPEQATPTDWSFQQRMEEALDVLEIMESQGMTPDPNLFCILIKSCADEQNLEFGKTFHSKLVGTKSENDVYVVNNLITMYAKCGRLETARRLFDKMPYKNAVSWTSVISMYSQSGSPKKALELYSMMKSESHVRPNVFTYTIALNSCAKLKNLKMGIEIHEDIVKDRCESDDFIATALVDMYSKCGRIDSARKVFDKIEKPTIAACTAMIDGYNNNGQANEAITLIGRVLGLGLEIRMVRELGFTCMIRSCILGAALRQGQEIHAHMIKFGYDVDGPQTMTAFIQLYERCGKMMLARRLFNKMIVKTAPLWGKMISGYVRNGIHREALELYVEMVHDNVEPTPSVFFWVLKACLGLGIYGLKQGKAIQGRAIKSGYQLNDSLVANVENV